jgi:hypothetical protein
VQLSCVKLKDAICGQARSIQGMASTYSVHQSNVPQGQRGTQVDGHWHSCTCSTGMFHGARRAITPAKRMIQAHDLNDRLHCRHCTHEHVRTNTRTIHYQSTKVWGEGVDRRKFFIIAIHKPAPQKLLQRGSSRSGLFVDRSSVLCLNVLDR